MRALALSSLKRPECRAGTARLCPDLGPSTHCLGLSPAWDRQCHRDSPAPHLPGSSVPWGHFCWNTGGPFLEHHPCPAWNAQYLSSGSTHGVWEILARWAMLLSPNAAGWHIPLDFGIMEYQIRISQPIVLAWPCSPC